MPIALPAIEYSDSDTTLTLADLTDVTTDTEDVEITISDGSVLILDEGGDGHWVIRDEDSEWIDDDTLTDSSIEGVHYEDGVSFSTIDMGSPTDGTYLKSDSNISEWTEVFSLETKIEGKTLQQHIKEVARMELYSATNIVLITVVSLMAYKLILPRLRIGWIIGKFKNLIFKPFKKLETEVQEEWKKGD